MSHEYHLLSNWAAIADNDQVSEAPKW